MDIVGSIFNLLFSSIFSINTYIGIVLGALFTPLWISIWRFAKAKLLAKFPGASIAFHQVEIAVSVVEQELTPAVESAKKAIDAKTEQLKK